VEALREAAEEEFRRRCELEKALREAASLFKRELFEKNDELASLQVRASSSELRSRLLYVYTLIMGHLLLHWNKITCLMV
jgi:hypothetical protein